MLESEWTLTANGGAAGTLSGPGAAGDTDVVSDGTFKAGTYVLSESGPTDYTASSWSCVKNGGSPVAGASITLGLGDTAVCTITNDDKAPKLTLDKIVVNDNGGTRAESEWTLTANGGAAGTLSGPGAAGSTDVVSGPSFKPGTYALSESGPTDYTASSWSCVKNGGSPVAGASITLGLGDTGVCTITNDDKAPGLMLDKIVVNDNGGTRAESEWTLTANGGAAGTLSGPGAAGDTDVVSGRTFKAGTYVLSESGPTDYSNGGFSCSKNGGEFAAATSITLGLGDTGVCKITNNDRAPGLTLDKIVVNDNGGTRAESEWTLTANGGAAGTLSGPGAAGDTDVVSDGTFKPGTYVLSESGPTDYSNGGFSCSKNGGEFAAATSITLGLGDTGVCTITNNDKAPGLTLDKIVVNDDGGTRAESEWTLTANGGAAGTLSGPGAAGSTDVVSGPSFKAGTYVLSESGPTDYSNGGFSCSKNGGEFAAATSITLGLGDTGVCKITNNDVAPQLKLVKIVDNLTSDSTKTPDNWTLYAEAADADLDDRDFDNAGGSGVLETVYAGVEYGLSEDPAPNTSGYSSTGEWSCTGTGFSLNDDDTGVTMELGGSATCQITNTILVRDLTLEKVWVKGFAGDTAALSVDGTTDGSATSKAPDAPGEINTVTVPVYSGETVNLTEVLGEKNTGTYTTVLECKDSQGTSLMMVVGSTDSEFTMPVDAVDVTCTFTNTRTVGDLVIKKVVVGDIAGASTEFKVNVACGPETGFTYTGVVLNEANKWTATIEDINSGLSCVVTEDVVPAGWALTSISPSPAVIGGEPVTVTVTNTRTVGDLVIKKVVVGDIAGASTEFKVNVDCAPGDGLRPTPVLSSMRPTSGRSP